MHQILLIITFVVIGICVLAVFYNVATVLNMWIMALSSGSKINVLRIVGMRLRRVDPRPIIYARVRLIKAGLDVSVHQLECHVLAGGDVAAVANALIMFHRHGVPITPDEVFANDLHGIDVVELARNVVERNDAATDSETSGEAPPVGE